MTGVADYPALDAPAPTFLYYTVRNFAIFRNHINRMGMFSFRLFPVGNILIGMADATQFRVLDSLNQQLITAFGPMNLMAALTDYLVRGYTRLSPQFIYFLGYLYAGYIYGMVVMGFPVDFVHMALTADEGVGVIMPQEYSAL
jgi:hypothetical protein